MENLMTEVKIEPCVVALNIRVENTDAFDFYISKAKQLQFLKAKAAFLQKYILRYKKKRYKYFSFLKKTFRTKKRRSKRLKYSTRSRSPSTYKVPVSDTPITLTYEATADDPSQKRVSNASPTVEQKDNEAREAYRLPFEEKPNLVFPWFGTLDDNQLDEIPKQHGTHARCLPEVESNCPIDSDEEMDSAHENSTVTTPDIPDVIKDAYDEISDKSMIDDNLTDFEDTSTLGSLVLSDERSSDLVEVYPTDQEPLFESDSQQERREYFESNGRDDDYVLQIFVEEDFFCS